MGEDSKKDQDEGKEIKFKCSICRKKMKINSKQIVKNVQLAHLIKSLDEIHGTSTYSCINNNETKNFDEKNGISELIENGNILNEEENLFKNSLLNSDMNENILDENEINKEKKIFCNLCKNIFNYEDHVKNNFSDFHKSNFLFLDNTCLVDIKNIFNLDEEFNNSKKNEDLAEEKNIEKILSISNKNE